MKFIDILLPLGFNSMLRTLLTLYPHYKPMAKYKTLFGVLNSITILLSILVLTIGFMVILMSVEYVNILELCRFITLLFSFIVAMVGIIIILAIYLSPKHTSYKVNPFSALLRITWLNNWRLRPADILIYYPRK